MSKENDSTINLGVAILIALAVVCSIGLMSLLVIKWEGSDRKEVTAVIAEREQKRADLEEGMAKERSSYRMISKEKGTVQLPLDVAMALTLKDLQNKSPQPSSVPVDPAAAVAPASEVELPDGEEAPAAVESEETESAPAPEEANE